MPAIFPSTTTQVRGGYLGSAAGASIPSATGKTPGNYYVISTAGGAYSVGDLAIVNSTSTGYDRIAYAAATALITGANITTGATWRTNLGLVTRESLLLGAPGLIFTGDVGSYLSGSMVSTSIGTGDFSVAWRMVTPVETTGGTTRIVWYLRPSAVSNANGCYCYFYNGTLYIAFLDAAGTSERRAYVSNWNTTYGGTLVDVVFSRTSTTAVLSVNGVVVSTSNNTLGGSPPADYSATVTSTWMFVGGNSSASLVGNILSLSVFNRVITPTALEVFDVPFGDRWGSQTTATSGVLVAGARYRIDSFVAGDSFTNLGAASNATGVEFISTGTTPTTWTNSSVLRRIGAIASWDLACGIGSHVKDLSTNQAHLAGTGTVFHRVPVKSGVQTVVIALAYSDISSSTGTTKVVELPANCGILRVEFDRTIAFDSSATLHIGTAGTAAKFVSAQSVTSTGIVLATSLDLTSQSNSAATSIYVQKTGTPTVGAVTIRLVYEIRG